LSGSGPVVPCPLSSRCHLSFPASPSFQLLVIPQDKHFGSGPGPACRASFPPFCQVESLRRTFLFFTALPSPLFSLKQPDLTAEGLRPAFPRNELSLLLPLIYYSHKRKFVGFDDQPIRTHLPWSDRRKSSPSELPNSPPSTNPGDCPTASAGSLKALVFPSTPPFCLRFARKLQYLSLTIFFFF